MSLVSRGPAAAATAGPIVALHVGPAAAAAAGPIVAIRESDARLDTDSSGREKVFASAVVRTENMAKYLLETSLKVYNRLEILGKERLLLDIQFTPLQIRAIHEFYKANFYQTPLDEYLNKTKEDVDIVPLMRSSPDSMILIGLRDQIQDIIDSNPEQFANGIFCRGYYSSPKDIRKKKLEERNEYENSTWAKFESDTKLDLVNGIFPAISQLRDLYDVVRRIGPSFTSMVNYLKANPMQRILIKMINERSRHSLAENSFMIGLCDNASFEGTRKTQERNKEGRYNLKFRLEEEYEFIQLIEEIEAADDPDLLEGLNKALVKITRIFKRFNAMEVTNREQFRKNVDAAWIEDPTSDIPEGPSKEKILKFLDSFGFSREKFESYSEHFEYLEKHSEEAAVVGAIEQVIIKEDREDSRCHTAVQVLDRILRSDRVMLDVQSCVQENYPFGIALGPFREMESFGQEYRVYMYDRNIVGVSSLTHPRARTSTTILPRDHILCQLVVRAIKGLLSGPVQSDQKTAASSQTMGEFISDCTFPEQQHLTPVIGNNAKIVRKYLKSIEVVDIAVKVNLITRTIVSAKLVELTPSYDSEDEVQITDSNCILWEHLLKQVEIVNKQASDQPSEPIINIDDYTLAAAFGMSNGTIGSTPFDMRAFRQLLRPENTAAL